MYKTGASFSIPFLMPTGLYPDRCMCSLGQETLEQRKRHAWKGFCQAVHVENRFIAVIS